MNALTSGSCIVLHCDDATIECLEAHNLEEELEGARSIGHIEARPRLERLNMLGGESTKESQDYIKINGKKGVGSKNMEGVKEDEVNRCQT